MIRIKASEKDYKDITTKMIKYDIADNLLDLTKLLNESINELSKKDLIKIAVGVNNILYSINE